MIPDLKMHLLRTLTVCAFTTPALAMGVDVTDRAVDNITRQVEQRAERVIERARDRRLEAIEQRVEDRVDQIHQQHPQLPGSRPIHTRQGRKAFNDVMLDTGFRAAERQWLATGPESQIAELDRPGITVLERRELAGLDMIMVRLRVTPGLDSLEALQEALPGLADQLDRNHIYSPQSGTSNAPTDSSLPQWNSLCTEPVRVGMVDTAIAADHGVFGRAEVVQAHFLALTELDDELAAPTAHGTAVASLMVGSQPGQWSARLPGASLFNASVFYGRDRELSGATLGHLLEGLNWLATQDVSVINISLTGPNNRLLATAMNTLRSRGTLLVAAVGNGGPAAPPLYPAAYPEVVGVTAVDASGELYRWANQGDQVMFAAPGVSVPVASPKGGLVPDSGTSLAAPVITAALACRRLNRSAEQAISSLMEDAQDLGEPGRDTRYGHGLLNY